MGTLSHAYLLHSRTYFLEDSHLGLFLVLTLKVSHSRKPCRPRQTDMAGHPPTTGQLGAMSLPFANLTACAFQPFCFREGSLVQSGSSWLFSFLLCCEFTSPGVWTSTALPLTMPGLMVMMSSLLAPCSAGFSAQPDILLLPCQGIVQSQGVFVLSQPQEECL